MTYTGKSKFLEYTLTALLIVVPAFIVPLGGYNDHFYYPKFMMLVFFSIALLLYVLINVHEIVQHYRPSRADAFLLIYTILMIVASLFAQDFMDALYGRAYRYTGLITHLMFVVLYFVAKLNGNLDKRSWVIVVSVAAILAFYGMLQHYGYDPIIRDDFRVGWNNAFSTFGNPNFAGSYYVMILPMSLYLVDQYGKKYLVLYAWILFSLLLSFSTAAWIGGFFSIALTLLWLVIREPKNSQRLKMINQTTVISVLVLVLFNVVTSNALLDEIGKTTGEGVEIVENGNENQSAGSGRIFIWTKTIVLISERPWLGYGVENMAEAFSRQFMDDMEDVFGYALTIDKAHNEYLQVAVDSGLPSLFVYIIFLGFTLLENFRESLKNSSFIFILAAVLGYLLQALFSFSVISVSYLFWILLGFASSARQRKKAI